MTQLIVFFAVQGIGAGALMPIGMRRIIGDLFPPERSGKMQGLFGAVLELYFSSPRARGSIPVRMKKSWRFLFVFEH
jgi:MFS family permease